MLVQNVCLLLICQAIETQTKHKTMTTKMSKESKAITALEALVGDMLQFRASFDSSIGSGDMADNPYEESRRLQNKLDAIIREAEMKLISFTAGKE